SRLFSLALHDALPIFGLGGGLHALADHLEAGVQRLGADLAVAAGEGVTQAGDDGVQAGAGRRVVVQLFTDLTADAVADTGFVGRSEEHTSELQSRENL